jgi:ATP-dependent DNA helicase RecQ
MRCVHETKEKLETIDLIDILQGEETSKVIKGGFNKLEIFGAGKKESLNFWKAIYRQLANTGAIYIPQNGTTSTKLTKKSLPLLTKKEKLLLYKIEDNGSASKTTSKKITKPRKKTAKKIARKITCDKEKFEYLKEFRRTLAKKKRTKAFKVFPDRTLEEFILYTPKNLAEMESLYGVGPKKLKKFGKDFLNALEAIT